jgi:hypothetical protein
MNTRFGWHSGAAATLLAAACILCAPGADAASIAAAVPLRRDGEVANDPTLWIPVVVMLVLCAVAGGYVVWHKGVGALLGGQADGRRTPRGSLARLTSQSLTPQASVHVLQWQGEELLVACTPQQVTLLARKAAAPTRVDTP